MMRSGLIIFCVFCVATLLAEVLGVTFLWSRGQLNSETLRDIQLVLSGRSDQVAGRAAASRPEQPSLEEVAQQRALRVLEFNTREKELDVLKSMVESQGREVLEKREALQKERTAFEDRLEQLQTEATSEAAERARNILLELQAADAVNSLMQLSVQQNVMLLKEMPEKEVAAILREFGQGDAEQQERGEKIFAALSSGEPESTIIEDVGKQGTAQTAVSPM